MDRKQMEKVIADGGTLLHEGRMISKLADLPTAADLAKGNAPRLEAELALVDEQIAKLATQKGKLQGELEKAKAAPTAVELTTPPVPPAHAPHATSGKDEPQRNRR